MKAKLFIKSLLITLLFGLWSSDSLAEPPTYYRHLTHIEHLPHDGHYCGSFFWSPDTLWGAVRTNDNIGIKLSPHFYGPVISSQDDFIYQNRGNPHFEHEPIFNAPLYDFPESYPHLRQLSNVRISDQDGRMLTRIALNGEDGILFYQRRLGIHRDEELILSIDPPDNQIIYIDGQVEIEGLLYGRATIYSTGDMWLTDNVRYDGARTYDGHFYDYPSPDNINEVRAQMMDFPHMLGLVSERNIIIKDNNRNGKENGFANGGNQGYDRHSIVINAALIALDESFTFQHQNDDYEAFQGPEPDERGVIHLTGGVTQYRRGYVHRSNHNGTGYGKDYVYDYRLEVTGPPGFTPDEFPDVSGRYDRLDLFIGPYTIKNTTARTVIIRAGVDVSLTGINALTVTDTLIIEGTSENPVTLRTIQQNGRSTIRVNGHNMSLIDIDHVVFSPNIVTRFQANNIQINNSEFGTEAHFTGNVTLDSSRFSGSVGIESWRGLSVSRSLFEDGITLTGNIDAGELINNTIIGGRTGIELRNRFDSLRIVNNIVAFNRSGIVNHHWEQPTIEYCDVYENIDNNYENCEPGLGTISADPRFTDRDRSDYLLQWNSPCIDAGNPDFSPDPDGTIADIGAFYRDHNLNVANETTLPEAFTVTASPNPFNRMVTIKFALTLNKTVHLSVYDLNGRETLSQRETFSAGVNKILVNGSELGKAGVYFARVQSGNDVNVVKLVYLP